jgi:hypothetical protein
VGCSSCMENDVMVALEPCDLVNEAMGKKVLLSVPF